MAQSNVRYLGYLRQDMPMPIIVNRQNVLQFYIEYACPRPSYFQPYITCYATSVEIYGFKDDPERPDIDRMEALYEWLMDRILTFRVHVRGTYQTAVDLGVYEMDPKADLWEYEPVPMITHRMVTPPIADALTKGLPLRGFELPERSPDLPLIVVANGHFYGPIERVVPSGATVGLRAGQAGLGRRQAVADGVEIINDQQTWFVERNRHRQLLQELTDAIGQEELAQAPEQEEGAEPEPEVSPKVAIPTAPARPMLRPPMTEADFLDRVAAQAHAQGLHFRRQDLLNFHTALKTGSLVVLSGLSGTGKSRLVEVYRQALGLAEPTQFLWLPVRPSWNDDADLIGYYDPLNRLYRPGETGLVDLLLRAAKAPDQLFMVCLDEMNLARVEHYLSQFLSNLERPLEQRNLRLYAPELRPEVQNGDRYPPVVPLGPNLLFCGTINVDESTQSFSDKVLDRSNLIRMEHVDLAQWWQEICRRESAVAAAPEAAPERPTINARTWGAWCTPFDPAPYAREIELLQGLNELLGQTRAEMRFGYRVVSQILLYLHRLPRGRSGEPLLDPATGLDQQVAQRILTKIRGTGAELRDLFCPDGTLESFLAQSPLSGFPVSRAEIRRKFLELERHDFTS